MSLFVLREGYQVVTTPSGGRIVHVRTGDALDLSAEDVQLFARATAGGVDAKDPNLRSLIRRFARLGVLVSAGNASKNSGSPAAPAPGDQLAPNATAPSTTSPPSVASVAAAAAVTSAGTWELDPPAPGTEQTALAGSSVEAPPKPKPEDAVRLFRTDLKISPRASSSALCDVSDPVTGKTFTLYDFEVSLTRMLDGQRSHADVLEAGQRLGIPVTLPSLLQFIRQLELYGFLAPPGLQLSDKRKGSARVPRQKWDEGLRALFQSGLRMHRQGRYAEATDYFQAMLAQDPQNPEALDLLEQVRQRVASGSGKSNTPLPPALDPARGGFAELALDDDFPALAESLGPPPSEPPSASAPAKPPEPAALVPPPSVAKPAEPVSLIPPPVAKPAEPASAAPRPPAPVEPAEISLPALEPASETKASPPAPAELPTVPFSSRDPRVRNAKRTLPAPPRSRMRTRWLWIGAAACAIGGSSAAAWYLFSPRPRVAADATQLPPSPKGSAPKAVAEGSPSQLASALPDAGKDAVVAAAGPADASVSDIAAPPRPDSSAQSAAETPAAETGAGKPRALARQAESASVATSFDAGVRQDISEWIAVRIENRGRVTMGEVLAPEHGIVSWRASPQQRVRRGEVIGRVRTQNGALAFKAPKDGLLIPKVPDGAETKKDEQIATIVYHEAYLQASVLEASPEPGWSCEVFQKALGEKASCKIVTVVRRGAKHLVTATTEPMWFDTADDPRLRLSAPR